MAPDLSQNTVAPSHSHFETRLKVGMVHDEMTTITTTVSHQHLFMRAGYLSVNQARPATAMLNGRQMQL